MGSSIVGLTEDIWIEIFLHLPLKPMFKSRCVSKVGLVLCATTPSDGEFCYYVCNPLTQKWVNIPPAPQPKPGVLSGKIGFECELLSSSLICTRYKVVRILQFEEDSDTFVVQIFSSDLGEWNFHEVSCPQALTCQFSTYTHPVTHKGVSYLNVGEYRMLVYNFDNSNNNNKAGGHQCQLIDLPDRSYEGENHVYGTKLRYFIRRCIGVSEGLICYAHIEERNNSLNVWVLEEKWQLLHKDIELHDLLTKIYNKLNNVLPGFHSELSIEVLHAYTNRSAGKRIQALGFSPADRNVVMLGYKSYVWAYNIRTRRYEELCCALFLPSIRFGEPFWMFTPFVFKPMPTILPHTVAPWLQLPLGLTLQPLS